MRRQRIVKLTPALVEQLCRTGEFHVYVAGMPKDAKCLGFRWNKPEESIEALFEHESFELVEPGLEAPIESVSFIRVPTKGEIYVERVDDDPSESDHGDVCVFR